LPALIFSAGVIAVVGGVEAAPFEDYGSGVKNKADLSLALGAGA